MVVTPLSKTEYKQSQDLVEYSSSEEDIKEKEQPSISSKAKGAGKSFKDLITSTGGKVTSSEVSQSLASVGNLEYNRILVPHDGSGMADKALNHAIYLSISGAEIVIIHVVEHMHNMDSSAVVVTSKERGEEKDGQKGFEITVEGEVKRVIEQKIRLCQQAGVKSQVSYKVQTGNR